MGMKKYRLVFNNNDTKSQQTIFLKGINDYEEVVELCFIDKFTTEFENELACINYLKSKNIITTENGSLSILLPNGYVKSETVIYGKKFNIFSKEISDKKRSGINEPRLSESYEQKKMSSMIINFFYNDNVALSEFCKTNFKNKNFSKLLKEYIELNVPKGWREPSEMANLISKKRKVSSMLQKYEILRNSYIWITEYQLYYSKKFNGYKSESKVKNPYEEYENKNSL